MPELMAIFVIFLNKKKTKKKRGERSGKDSDGLFGHVLPDSKILVLFYPLKVRV